MFEIIKKIRTFFTNLFAKDVFIKIGSLVAAIVIWFIVSVSVYQTMDDVFYNVQVEIDISGTYAEASGYQPMTQSEETVTVYITGDRGEIGNLKSEDLVAVASAENVMYAREYRLPLEIRCKSNKDFEVTKIEPSVISVDFDRIVTKEVELKSRLSGVRAEEGYIMGEQDDIVIVPNIVNVTGPAEMVENITDAMVVISEDTLLTETTDFKADSLSFFNGSVPITDENDVLSFDKTEFTVHVPVYERRTVSLNLLFANAPESFNIEAFKEKLDMSVTELEIAVPSESIREMNSIENSIDIGTIDMREVDIGSEFTFSTADFLPEGCQDLGEVKTVTVKCPSDGLVRRPIHFTGSSIQLVNAPAQFNVDIITSGVTAIFIGSAESMEQLTYIDIIAQIDMYNSIDAESGSGYYKLPVTFVIPFYDDVWCVGSDDALTPRVTINATPKGGN
ncbi:MAG: hypothetical protein J1F11_13335 [Oscillospiraceae bacterium]|nr:hypothetical protein [Oscillospiraceae bacterium]